MELGQEGAMHFVVFCGSVSYLRYIVFFVQIQLHLLLLLLLFFFPYFDYIPTSLAISMRTR